MDKKGRLLIVEDIPAILQALQFLLESEFGHVTSISNPNLLPATIRSGHFDLVLLDMNFTAGINTGNEGLFWLAEIRKYDPTICVIMMTAYGAIDLAVAAIKIGAIDFFEKPWDNDKLLTIVRNGLKLRKSKLALSDRTGNSKYPGNVDKTDFVFIGECPEIRMVMELVDKVSKTDANILLTGENGTGKGVIAREIHNRSNRAKHPMVTVDMSSIPDSLFESELFGHKKGAFTDARSDRTGRFETANQSTLFLDEIGNLPMNMQIKILNVIQERQIIPIGSNNVIPIDIRLVCATNKNLDKLVAEGTFRQDLLFRINTIQIDLPPLRRRGRDIDLMAAYFLEKFSVKYKKGPLSFHESAIHALNNYSWPGNIRELEHSIEKAVILVDSMVVQADDLQLKKEYQQGGMSSHLPDSFDDYEKIIIKKTLLRNMGNLSNAARELGISRPTLYKKMKQYGF